MLCACCKRVFDQPIAHYKDGIWISHAEWTVPLAVIQKSSLSCVACHAMVRMLKRLQRVCQQERQILKITGFFHSAELRQDSLPYATYEAWDAEEMTFWGSFRLLIEQVKDKGSLELIVRAASTSANSPITFAFIKDCMRKCQTSHKICRAAATQPPWYPTRLIQVEDSRARLIITRDTPPQGPYATLSHCWGGHLDVMQCTSNNLEELKNGIELTSLPANFRDALHAIRALGIAYIWVDSLCVMRDSYADKIIEIKTMLNVFRQSVLTLAATRAADSHAGLFAPRSPENLFAGPFRISNGVLNGMFVAVEAAADTWYWDDVIDCARLNLRGWVLQERLLSPRIVHFTDDQVIWDCAESTAPEFVPSGVRAKSNPSVHIGPKSSSDILAISPGEDEALRQWSRIVDSYSRCQLSRASDKLLALSGVADSLRSILEAGGGEGGYYVGLWRVQMELQLCWRTDRRRGGSLPASNRLAPSWSWMSVDGAVTAFNLRSFCKFRKHIRRLAQVVGVDMEEPGENCSRQHGSLRLCCILNTVELETEPWPTLRGATVGEDAILHLDSADAADTAGTLFFAPILGLGVASKRAVEPYPLFELIGLLLERVGDEATGVYLRRGFVQTDVKEGLYFRDGYLSTLPVGARPDQPASSDIFAGPGRVITIQ